jgi:hypothetical protein
MLRSPVSHLERKECALPVRAGTSRCIRPASSRVEISFWRNLSYFQVKKAVLAHWLHLELKVKQSIGGED